MGDLIPASPEKRTLYAGFDDSNHIGKVKAEIVVGVFSFFSDDGIVMSHPNRRKFIETERWLEEGRAYRCTILTGSQLTDSRGKYNSTNLPFAAPYLVRRYLASLVSKERQEVTGIRLYFDGRITDEHVAHLRFSFKDFQDFDVKGFVKKSRTGKNTKSSKRPICPAVVYRADVIANGLFKSLRPDNTACLDGLAEDDLFVRI